MIYIFIGKDIESKDKKIGELKKKYLTSKEAVEFDLVSLYSQKLDPKELKKNLISLPSVSSKRVIILHQFNKLKPDHKKIILGIAGGDHEHIVLILETDEENFNDSFTKSLRPFAKVIDLSSGKKMNVFDMTRAISMRKPKEAIKMLDGLLSSGDHPLQLMGGLVWFWGKAKSRMPAERFKKGLAALQEADLNIKRSRLKPEYALELLIVKLCSFI